MKPLTPVEPGARLALGIAWAVCLLGWLFVSLIPASYESSARIMVRPQTVLSEKVGITAGERRKAVEQFAELFDDQECAGRCFHSPFCS